MTDRDWRMWCGHCEMETTFKLVHEFWEPAPTSVSTTPDESTRRSLVGFNHRIWRIFLCLVCLNPTLEYEEQVVVDGHRPVRTTNAKVLYPVPKAHLDNVPETIEKEYRAALKYQNRDPNACAVYVGRALDRICRHEKVEGKRLIEKLRNLVREKNLPIQLGIMADQLRELRNIGAHADEDDVVTEEDAPVMLYFLEALLEYLYIAPTKIARVQARLKKTL